MYRHQQHSIDCLCFYFPLKIKNVIDTVDAFDCIASCVLLLSTITEKRAADVRIRVKFLNKFLGQIVLLRGGKNSGLIATHSEEISTLLWENSLSVKWSENNASGEVENFCNIKK